MKTIPAELLKPYWRATREGEGHHALALAAADRRAEALKAIHDQGYSFGDIARAIGATRSLVQKLVDRARRKETK